MSAQLVFRELHGRQRGLSICARRTEHRVPPMRRDHGDRVSPTHRPTDADGHGQVDLAQDNPQIPRVRELLAPASGR
jgi:hypothetical protein